MVVDSFFNGHLILFSTVLVIWCREQSFHVDRRIIVVRKTEIDIFYSNHHIIKPTWINFWIKSQQSSTPLCLILEKVIPRSIYTEISLHWVAHHLMHKNPGEIMANVKLPLCIILIFLSSARIQPRHLNPVIESRNLSPSFQASTEVSREASEVKINVGNKMQLRNQPTRLSPGGSDPIHHPWNIQDLYLAPTFVMLLMIACVCFR